jgi:hypothetical protein
MLTYKKASLPLALTVHRVGDTTDCKKLSFERTDLYISGASLERFLRKNIKIKLLDDESDRMESLSLMNEQGLYGPFFDARLIILVQK